MADNFGSNYAVGGFGSGFAQGMGLANEQQRLGFEKQKAAREQDLFNRSKAQDELRGAYNQMQYLAQAEHDNPGSINPDNYNSTVKSVDSAMRKNGLPGVNSMYEPEFKQYLDTSNAVLSGQMDKNDPQALHGLNYRYNDQIQRGVGETLKSDLKSGSGGAIIPAGATAQHKEIVQLVPGANGSVIPEVRTTFSWKDKDGQLQTANHDDPLTLGRTHDPGDNVTKPVSVHDLFDQHMSDMHFYQAFQDPSIKAGIIGKYLANGGKMEELEPPLKKTSVIPNYYYTDPKSGKAMVGTAIFDQYGGHKITDGIAASSVPTSGYYRGMGAAEYKTKFSTAQTDKTLSFLTDMFQQQVNPDTQKPYERGEAMQLAWKAKQNGDIIKFIPKLAEKASQDSTFTKGGFKSQDEIANEMLRTYGGSVDAYTSPGANPNNPSQPQAKTLDRVVQKGGKSYNLYTDGSTEPVENATKPGVVTPKPGAPAPSKAKGLNTIDKANYDQDKKLIQDKGLSRQRYYQLQKEIQDYETKMRG